MKNGPEEKSLACRLLRMPVIDKLLSNEDVDYLQINSTAAGCFTFRIERVSNSPQLSQVSALAG